MSSIYRRTNFGGSYLILNKINQVKLVHIMEFINESKPFGQQKGKLRYVYNYIWVRVLRTHQPSVIMDLYVPKTIPIASPESKLI